MFKYINIGLLGILLSLKDCASFEKAEFADLSEAVKDTAKEVGIPALKYNNGDLMEGPVWWTGSNPGEDISLQQKDGYYLKFKNVGPKYTPFGQGLPGLDFSNNLAVKVTCVAEGEDMPMLCLQLDDVGGFQTNAKRPTNRIANDGKMRDYYFSLKGAFVQSWPSAHSVDAAAITKIMFFVNPGGSAYNGALKIKEIKVIPADSVKKTEPIKPAVGRPGAVIDNFSGDINDWWTTDKFFKISKTTEGSLKVEIKGAGPGYECIGRGFKAINFSKAYKLKAKIRVEGAQEAPEVRIDIKDVDGYTCNAKPATNRILPNPDGTMKEYTFSYRGRFLQTYPDMHEVDSERITDMVIFINPGKAPFTGTIYIDDIEAIPTGE
ncbi:MAG: hypothetical protein U0V72_04770 [Cytophagales bacterium]